MADNTYQVPMFESFSKAASKAEEVEELKDALSEYVPQFSFSEVATDSDFRADGNISVWVEFSGVDPKVGMSLQNAGEYEKIEQHFKRWLEANQQDFGAFNIGGENVLTVDDVVTFEVIYFV